MRRPLRAAALCILAGALAACSGGRPRGPMSDGERMYMRKCTSCHRAYEPSSRTAAQWQDSMAEMEKQKKVHLGQEDRALILGYLLGTEANSAPAQQ